MSRTSRWSARGRGLGLVGVLLVGAGGCAGSKVAIVDGKEVPRLDLDLTGQAYSVRHRRAHPRPGGPSGGLRGDGGSIGGTVCGMQVDYDVEHDGDHVQLIGFIDGSMPSQLQIRDEQGVRHITGAINRLGVDLRVRGDHIEGSVGIRVLVVEVEGDDYVGYMRAPGIVTYKGGVGAYRLVIHGRSALWALPPADQAALLPTVLTCYAPYTDGAVVTPMVVGFGGPATALPPQTSAVYTGGR